LRRVKRLKRLNRSGGYREGGLSFTGGVAVAPTNVVYVANGTVFVQLGTPRIMPQKRTNSRRLIPARSIQSSIRLLLDHKTGRVPGRFGLPACRFRQLAEILFVCQPLGDSPC